MNLNRATTIRHGRDATIMYTFPSLVGTLMLDDPKVASVADLRASFMILHELVLLQKLVERIKSTWGPPAQWTAEQYQELVQSISLAQEKSGSSQLENNSILAEAFQLRYQFEEIAENQPKIRQIQDVQQKNSEAVLGADSVTTRGASNSIILPPAPPRLRCPTIYSYYSTFEQLSIATSSDSSPRSSADGRTSSGAAPLTPRSATIAKYAHLYLEDDARTKKPWSWERSVGDDLIEGWTSGEDGGGLKEPARIVEELCDRFSHDKIYSYINDHAMVLFNPHRILQTSKFTSIYDEQVVLTYAMTPYVHSQLAPHPFAMAKQGLLRLFYTQATAEKATKSNDMSLSLLPIQTIFLSGESGSGKTELAKELLKYFVLSAQPTSSTARGSRPRVKLFTSSTKSTTQMRTEETRTMALLEAKGVDTYEIVLLDLYPERWSEMTSVSKSKRIPQVHIDGLFFGFYEKLESLEDEEQLRMYFKNPHAARKLSTVLDSNILLEAFGNATTSMNLNSSRFGKATTLYFSFDRHPSEYQVLGCRLVPFLLEKSRVTSMKGESIKDGVSEANFHVFYALVSGVNAIPYMRLLAKDLRLDNASSETFVYLGKCKHKLQGAWTEDETWKKDVERWQHVLDAMNSMDLPAGQQRAIFQVLSAILWLGNVDFQWNSSTKKLEMVSQSKESAENNVVALLGLESVARLESVLFTKHIQMTSTGESFDIALEKGQVSHLRDTLARLLYQVVFHYLVAQMNEATKVDNAAQLEADRANENLRALKLVDVFGFENLGRNSLEQLCINYLSEKLFAAEEQIISLHYGSAKVPADSAEKDKDVLFLFEHPLGIFASLEELTVLHQGENENWQQEQKKNQLLVRNLYERNASRLLDPPRLNSANGKQLQIMLPFVVPHSRESVVYDASEFVKKNSDFQHAGLMEGLETSSNTHLREMLGSVKDAFNVPSQKNKRGSTTTTSTSGSQANQFRAQVQVLTTQVDGSMPLYMHCIRPNSTGRPSNIEAQVVERQLKSHLLLSQIRLCGEALESASPSYVSMKMPRDFFVKRYRSLFQRQAEGVAERTKKSDEELQQQIEKLVPGNEAPSDQSPRPKFKIGSESMLLFHSAEVVEKLDLLLELRQTQAVIAIQSFARMLQDRFVFLAKQKERKSLKNELIELYGEANMKKVENILNKYHSKEDELRAKIAVKKRIAREEHVQIEHLERDLKSLCLSSEGGLRAETVNEILSDEKICALLQQNESIVSALRDMSLDPGVLTSQLANPVLRSFYQDLVAVLLEKRAAAIELARSKQLSQKWSPQLSIEDRVQNLVTSGREKWKAAAAFEEWSEHRDKLEEIGDEPELLVFHLEDEKFVAVLEDFVTKLEVQKAKEDSEALLIARMQEDSAKAQAHATEVEMELLEMLLKVELDESLMAAMREDPFFIQALENPVLIASMQQVCVMCAHAFLLSGELSANSTVVLVFTSVCGESTESCFPRWTPEPSCAQLLPQAHQPVAYVLVLLGVMFCFLSRLLNTRLTAAAVSACISDCPGARELRWNANAKLTCKTNR